MHSLGGVQTAIYVACTLSIQSLAPFYFSYLPVSFPAPKPAGLERWSVYFMVYPLSGIGCLFILVLFSSFSNTFIYGLRVP